MADASIPPPRHAANDAALFISRRDLRRVLDHVDRLTRELETTRARAAEAEARASLLGRQLESRDPEQHGLVEQRSRVPESLAARRRFGRNFYDQRENVG